MIKVRDRKWHNFTSYFEQPFVLKIKWKNYYDHGVLESWDLSSSGERHFGSTVEDFKNTLISIRNRYLLGVHSKTWRDCAIIYVDHVEKIKGFFDELITDVFPKKEEDEIIDPDPIYYQLLQVFEVRSFLPWKEKATEDEALEMMNKIYETYFLPEKYFYITPNQRMRKRIAKACSKEKSITAKTVFPANENDYELSKLAVFGGLCYCKVPNFLFTDSMMALDLVSAYIYSFLVKKHCATKAKEVNSDLWEAYISNEAKASIGIYELEYDTVDTAVRVFKDEDGENFPVEKGAKVRAVLCSTDVETILNMKKVYIKSINCLYLEEYCIRYLDNYMREALLTEYLNKKKIDKEQQPYEYAQQKIVLNGIAGNAQRYEKTRSSYINARKNASIAPQWGIFLTAYVRQLVIFLGQTLKGWRYSDTDSIYCLDCFENRKKVEEYNNTIRDSLKDFCNLFDYDYEELKDLGTFKIEEEIQKFVAFSAKHYAYMTKENKVVVKAAGCDKDNQNFDEHVFDTDENGDLLLKYIPVGEKIERCTDDGYYERKISGMEAQAIVMLTETIKGYT